MISPDLDLQLGSRASAQMPARPAPPVHHENQMVQQPAWPWLGRLLLWISPSLAVLVLVLFRFAPIQLFILRGCSQLSIPN
jgi:hypothetical protein